MYFCRPEETSPAHHIYRSRLSSEDGSYLAAERLPETVNAGRSQFNAFIAPDESYLIVCTFGIKETVGATDYYICYRDENDRWTRPINLGDTINTPGGMEFSPYVTHDQKYFFFMSSRLDEDAFKTDGGLDYVKFKQMFSQPRNGNTNTYWIKADFIEKLRPRPEAAGSDQ